METMLEVNKSVSTETGANGLSEPKKTPLYENHKALGAKFTEFGGWMMPVLYSGLVDEHHSVRNNAGLFDVSHMGEVRVKGPEAFKFLQYIASNDLNKIKRGQAQYSLLLNPNGGIVDDIIIYKFADDEFFICVNAANTAKDVKWLHQHNKFDCIVTDESSKFSQIALQGPKSREVLAKLLLHREDELSPSQFPPFTFKFFRCTLPTVGPTELIVACTGYTGEDGFEIFAPAEAGPVLWDLLLDYGKYLPLKPAGLGARDTLRLEVCYPLHGHELSDDVSALSSGVGWVVALEKEDFLGKEALLKIKAEGVSPRLVGLEVVDAGIVREGAKIFDQHGEDLGVVTSGTKPPTVNKSVAIALLKADQATLGNKVWAEVRGRKLQCKVIPRPFYKRPS